MIRLLFIRLTPDSYKITAGSHLCTALRALGVFAIWLTVSSAQAQFYKWVDDAGRIQYSETPPPSREFQVIAPRPSAPKADRPVPVENSPSQSLGQKDQKPNNSDKKVQTTVNNKLTRKKNCDAATQNLNTLQSRGRLRIFDGKEYRILGPEEREAKISEAEKQIEQYCG